MDELYYGIFDGRRVYAFSKEKDKLIHFPKELFFSQFILTSNYLSYELGSASLKKKKMKRVLEEVLEKGFNSPAILVKGIGMRRERSAKFTCYSYLDNREVIAIPLVGARVCAEGHYFIMSAREEVDKVNFVLKTYCREIALK